MVEGDDHQPAITGEGRTTHGAGQWQVTEEFSQRLGCGVVTAVILPVWFGLMLLAGSANPLATTVGSVLFGAALVGGIVGWRRIRTVPRVVQLDDAGRLRFVSRAGETVREVGDLCEVRLGSSLGIKPVRLDFGTAGAVRVSGDLDDLEGFLATLQAANPRATVTDRRGVGEQP